MVLGAGVGDSLTSLLRLLRVEPSNCGFAELLSLGFHSLPWQLLILVSRFLVILVILPTLVSMVVLESGMRAEDAASTSLTSTKCLQSPRL